MTPRRILVLRSGAIGDLIVTFPVLQVIRAHWKGTSIDIIAPPAMGRLACKSGLADQMRSIDDADCAALYSPTPLSEIWRSYLAQFDLILNYLHDPTQIVASHLNNCCHGRIVNHSPLVHTGHAIDHFLKPLLDSGICLRGNEYPWLSFRDGRKNDDIVLHPGSGSPAKNWPLSNFIMLGQLIATQHHGNPVFICGEAESAMIAPLQNKFGTNAVRHGLPLEEIALLLANCRAYVGNDSGITHLSTAAGAPTLALFGPSPVLTWAPRGPRVMVINATSPTSAALSSISPQYVFQVLNEFLQI